jgi:hypothetical protein
LAEKAVGAAPAVPLKSTPEPANFRLRLQKYYAQYNPTKLDTVDDILKKHQGREEILFNSLVSKYGPEPK